MNPEQDLPPIEQSTPDEEVPTPPNLPTPPQVSDYEGGQTYFNVPDTLEYSESTNFRSYLKIFVVSFILIALLGLCAYFILLKMTQSTPAAPDSSATTAYTPPASPVPAASTSISTLTSPQPSQTASAPLANETYKSKINKKVSFLVPVGSTVIENGSLTSITFNINSPDNKTYIMTYGKAAQGCFDAIGSFSIGAGEGVDFRIIQDNKDLTLKNNLHAIRLFEMYGSYAGMIGFRGNACLQSAVPTRIEIKASGYGRYEGSKAYLLFDEMINSLTV